MIKVFRFSNTGWTPQYQGYHLDQLIEYKINNLMADINKFSSGVWVFIQIEQKNFYLNHLEEASLYPLLELELPEYIFGFHGDLVFQKEGWLSLRELKKSGVERVYLPGFIYEPFLKNLAKPN